MRIISMVDPTPAEKLPDEAEQRHLLDQVKEDPLLQGLSICIAGFSEDDTPPEPKQGNAPLPSRAVLKKLCADDLGLVVNDKDEEGKGAGLFIISEDILLNETEVKTLQRIPTVVVCRKDNLSIPSAICESLITLHLDDVLKYMPQQDLSPHKLGKAIIHIIKSYKETKAGTSAGGGNPIPTAAPAPEPWSFPDPVLLRDPSSSTTKLEFLVVEDNEINIKILSKYMTAMNQSYRVARDGQEALDTFKQDPSLCRCILMDISMPVMDGIKAGELIREYEKEKQLDPAIIAGLAAGGPRTVKPWPCFDFYIRKPFPRTHFEEALRSRGLLDQ